MIAPWLGLHWARPWAAAVAAVPLLLGARQRRARYAGAAAAYADVAMRRWALRESAARAASRRSLLEFAVWGLLATALAGPRLPSRLGAAGAARPAHRIELMVLLELPAPGPGARAALAARRSALHEWLTRLHGERVGLIVFTAGAGLLLPCTDDAAAFEAALRSADPALLQGIAGPGLPGALALARRALQRQPGRARALLLLADASATRALAPAAREALRRQAAALRAAHWPLYLAWSGPAAPGPLLASLVARSGGALAPLRQPGTWRTLYDAGIARLAPDPDAAHARGGRGWRELDAIPLAAAVLLLLASLSRPWRRRAVLVLALGPVCAAGLGLPTGAHAAALGANRRDRQAWAAWQAWTRDEYSSCATLYAAQTGYRARIGEGDCRYRAGLFPQAFVAYRQAVLLAADDRRRAVALYNLGNAAFHLPGRVRAALDAYRASLVLWPHDAAARRNLRLAQAQWAEDHPESELVGLRKRGGAAADPARFGDTTDTAPSQQRRPGPKLVADDADPRLQAGGRLRALAAGTPAPAGSRASPAPVDLAAVRRGLRLLHDRHARLLRRLMEHDSRVATALAAGR